MTTRISEATRAQVIQAWPTILAGIAAGELIKDVLAKLGLSRAEVNVVRLGNPALLAEWEAAREVSADGFMDEALSVARNPVQAIPQEDGKEPLMVRLDPGHTRNLVDTLKWAARIRNPKLYGDKAQLDVNVRTVDLTRIIEAANARVLGRQPRVLENNSGSDSAHARSLPAPIEALLVSSSGLDSLR